MLMYLLRDNKTTQKILFLLQTLKPSQSHNSCVQFGSLITGCTWVEVKAVNQNWRRLEAYPGKERQSAYFFSFLIEASAPPTALAMTSCRSVDSTAPPGLGKGRERRERGAGNIFRVQYCCGLAGTGFSGCGRVLKSTLTHGELCGLLEGLYPLAVPQLSFTWYLSLWLPVQGVWLAPRGCPLGLGFSEAHHLPAFPCWGLHAPLVAQYGKVHLGELQVVSCPLETPISDL